MGELMMALNKYDTAPFNRSSELSFRNMLEGWVSSKTGKVVDGQVYMHNLVHNFLNGTMSIIEATANDPMFFLHHAPIGHNYGYHMVPFLPIYRNIEYLLSKNLGYEYDYLQDLAASEIDVAVWSDWTEWSECMLPGLDIRCKPIPGTQ